MGYDPFLNFPTYFFFWQYVYRGFLSASAAVVILTQLLSVAVEFCQISLLIRGIFCDDRGGKQICTQLR